MLDDVTTALFANVYCQDILSILGAVRTKLSLRPEFCDDGRHRFHAALGKPLGATVWARACTIDVNRGLCKTTVALSIFTLPT